MHRKNIYLLLCLAGLIGPYWQFVPWLAEHGLNVSLMFRELFSTRIGAFFGMDVLISTLVIVVWARLDRAYFGPRWWLGLVALAMVGVSLALPLMLYLRETHKSAA